jgi:hypothetical protein
MGPRDVRLPVWEVTVHFKLDHDEVSHRRKVYRRMKMTGRKSRKARRQPQQPSPSS